MTVGCCDPSMVQSSYHSYAAALGETVLFDMPAAHRIATEYSHEAVRLIRTVHGAPIRSTCHQIAKTLILGEGQTNVKRGVFRVMASSSQLLQGLGKITPITSPFWSKLFDS